MQTFSGKLGEPEGRDRNRGSTDSTVRNGHCSATTDLVHKIKVDARAVVAYFRERLYRVLVRSASPVGEVNAVWESWERIQ